MNVNISLRTLFSFKLQSKTMRRQDFSSPIADFQ